MGLKRRYPAARLERESRQLIIDWPDGHHSEYLPSDLRAACPCAECNASRQNSDPLKLAAAPVSQARSMSYIGNYAIQFVWDDGHSFGIYPWEMLRSLCPCALCRAGTESE